MVADNNLDQTVKQLKKLYDVVDVSLKDEIEDDIFINVN